MRHEADGVAQVVEHDAYRRAVGVLVGQGHHPGADLCGVLQQAVALWQVAFRRLLEVLGHRRPLACPERVLDQASAEPEVRCVAARVRYRRSAGGAHVRHGSFPVAILQREHAEHGLRAIDHIVVLGGLLMVSREGERVVCVLPRARKALCGTLPGLGLFRLRLLACGVIDGLGPHVGALRRAGKVEQAILRWERRDRRILVSLNSSKGVTRAGGLKPALDCPPALGVPELCQGAACPCVLWIQRRGAFEATAAESVVADGRGVPPHQRISCGRQQVRIAARLELASRLDSER